jgi:hypothetical protein
MSIKCWTVLTIVEKGFGPGTFGVLRLFLQKFCGRSRRSNREGQLATQERNLARRCPRRGSCAIGTQPAMYVARISLAATPAGPPQRAAALPVSDRGLRQAGDIAPKLPTIPRAEEAGLFSGAFIDTA